MCLSLLKLDTSNEQVERCSVPVVTGAFAETRRRTVGREAPRVGFASCASAGSLGDCKRDGGIADLGADAEQVGAGQYARRAVVAPISFRRIRKLAQLVERQVPFQALSDAVRPLLVQPRSRQLGRNPFRRVNATGRHQCAHQQCRRAFCGYAPARGRASHLFDPALPPLVEGLAAMTFFFSALGLRASLFDFF